MVTPVSSILFFTLYASACQNGVFDFDLVVTFTFETGSEKYKELENGVYVGAGHFVKQPGQEGLIVEYQVSKVVKG